MRCSRLLVSSLSLMIITACQERPPESSNPPTDGATSQTGATESPKWSDAVVWNGDLNTCRRGPDTATRECLRDAMRADGASADAVAAAQQLSSDGELAYVSAWHAVDGVGVATVDYPFRANTNQGTRLLDAQGKLIDVDAAKPDESLRADPALKALLDAHPQATAFAPARSAGTSPLEGGGLRLLYRTPLRDCHACADVGQLQIGYDFDDKRNFIGEQVIAASP